MAKERLSLYFDTEIPAEKAMWEYICKDGKNRKSYNIKRALEIVIENVINVDNENLNIKSNETIEETLELSPTVIDTNNEDDLEEDELPF
jgi:type IV secretory pathway VirD2 relaxase